MAIIEKTEIVLKREFDPRSCKHTINGITHVLHCHHYIALYCQLADDCGMLDGRKLLSECAEDSFIEVFEKYFDENCVESVQDRIAICEQYYAVSGLGQMKVVFAGPDSGMVELSTSHVDQGWIKKWGNSTKPINFITCGFIAAIFSAVFDRPVRTYVVTETESMATGAEKTKFSVVIK